jgi:hypothetical protein
MKRGIAASFPSENKPSHPTLRVNLSELCQHIDSRLNIWNILRSLANGGHTLIPLMICKIAWRHHLKQLLE